LDIINLGIGKVLKICAYLGIKVQKKPNGAIGQIVKNRFKKDKKDFLEYEIDELNKSLDSLENIDEEKPDKPLKGKVPIDVEDQTHFYPQKMPLRPPHGHVHPDIVVPPEHPPVDVKPDGDKPEPPSPIPSVTPEPPNKPPKGENGIK
jgi:hypothetical protein